MNKALSAVEIAVEQALSVLRQTPSALVTDVDGTISPIVSRPEDASVSGDIQSALSRLNERLALVAVITARQEVVARSMVGVEGLTYIGNYAVKATSAGSHAAIDAASLIGFVRPFLDSNPCVMLEEKGIGFSLHYRNCQAKGVREQLVHLLQPRMQPAGAKLVEGKQVIEVVPANLPDKGSALARLLDGAGIRGAVYLGDDLSDVAAFREIARRSSDAKPSLSIAVVDDESPMSVKEAAGLELDGVTQVTQLLNRLAERLKEGT